MIFSLLPKSVREIVSRFPAWCRSDEVCRKIEECVARNNLEQRGLRGDPFQARPEYFFAWGERNGKKIWALVPRNNATLEQVETALMRDYEGSDLTGLQEQEEDGIKYCRIQTSFASSSSVAYRAYQPSGSYKFEGSSGSNGQGYVSRRHSMKLLTGQQSTGPTKSTKCIYEKDS